MMIEYMCECPPDPVEWWPCSECGQETHANDLECISQYLEIYLCPDCLEAIKVETMSK